jgi:GNAT superfamily N-acetyltransferase
MADLLVKLYNIPAVETLILQLEKENILICRSLPSHKAIVTEWVRTYFPGTWPLETEAAYEQRPITCFVAVHKQPDHLPAMSLYDQAPELLVGFAIYDVTARGLFGPTGVREDYRGKGIGKALLLACLHAMKEERYAYAIIGWAGPVEFYSKAVGATVISGSEPGIFRPLPSLE